MQQCLSEGAFSTVWLAQDIGMAVFFSLPGIAFIYFILRIHSEASLAVKMSISFWDQLVNSGSIYDPMPADGPCIPSVLTFPTFELDGRTDNQLYS